MPVQFGSPELCDVISDRMQAAPQQRITFAEFMGLALYHPDYGYYTAHGAQLGYDGDFVTSVHLGKDFGELLAIQLLEMWHKLSCPHPFHVVEMGPGQGILAEIILSYWQTVAPECLAAVRYTLVEKSSSLQQVQQQRLQSWLDQGITLAWSTLAAIPQDSVVGCLFSNELVDALPVHRVVLTEAGLQEQYITTSDQEDSRFQAVLGDLSTPDLNNYFERLGISIEHPTYPLGYTTEINLAALPWLEQVTSKLHQGYILTIDYGYPAQRYYSPMRSQGTLQCYYRHAYHDEPLINVGQQDLTAHVDFTTLTIYGQQQGLITLGTAPQELFLMALGLGDRLQELAQLQGTDSATLAYAIQRRETLHQLINPIGLGKFTALIQGKGLTTTAQRELRGLTIPPMG